MNPNQRDNPASSEETKRVFQVALSLVPAAEAFAHRRQLTSGTGHDAMMEAAKRVVQSGTSIGRGGRSEGITNLPGYLFTVARHLMVAELKRQREEVSIDDEQNSPALTSRLSSRNLRSIENRILLSEIVRRMNPKARAIYTSRTHGYDYHEIAAKFREKGYKTTAATLRSELSKAIKQITKELEEADYY